MKQTSRKWCVKHQCRGQSVQHFSLVHVRVTVMLAPVNMYDKVNVIIVDLLGACYNIIELTFPLQISMFYFNTLLSSLNNILPTLSPTPKFE